jgi:hypothetical protein
MYLERDLPRFVDAIVQAHPGLNIPIAKALAPAAFGDIVAGRPPLSLRSISNGITSLAWFTTYTYLHINLYIGKLERALRFGLYYYSVAVR